VHYNYYNLSMSLKVFIINITLMTVLCFVGLFCILQVLSEGSSKLEKCVLSFIHVSMSVLC